ncbi:hypothetical protein C1S70_30470 (plasmid) [Azospirillum argentinense]|uniref:HTH araC/xylS-type domain-containing protein n=1 Tax=Azospirillum argentinense TaxID=2970906 RepID=A0A2K1FRK9_9PROT|nr:hypothetical protein C1S70_30470 [Azospirillum argentinense]
MGSPAVPADEPAIPVLRFPPDGVLGRERVRQSRDILSVFFDAEPAGSENDTEDVPEGGGAGFVGSMTTYHLGSLLMARIDGPPVTLRRTSATIARSAAEHCLIQVYLDGGCTGTAGERAFAMRTGDVGVLDLAQPLAVETTAFSALTLVIPRAGLILPFKAPEFLHGLVLPAASAIGTLLNDHVRSLHAQLPGLSVKAAAAVAGGAIGVIAAGIGSALDACAPIDEPQGALLDRIKNFIDRKLDAADLGTDLICDAFGLSRSTLYRLFEPLGGVAKHVRDRRLARALHDLAASQPDRPRIADIAYHWGFGSEAAFSRAFRAAYGMTPGEARDTAERMRQSAPKDVGAAERVLERWMRSLTPGNLPS